MLRRLTIGLLVLTLAACSGGNGSDAGGEDAPHAHGPDGTTVSLLVGDGTEESAAGYQLTGVSVPRTAETAGQVRFSVTYEGRPVRQYLQEQTKELHLYVVRTDLAVFRHLHPVLDRDGTWSAPVTLPEPGTYRVITEFVAKDQFGDGDFLMLGTTATVDGAWRPQPVEPPTVGDDGTLRVGAEGTGTTGPDGQLHLTVRDEQDRPVTLGTYLGVFAHVTAFHVKTGSVVHMHPLGSPEVRTDSTELTFHTEFEKPGEYLAFVQTRVDGMIHTVPVGLTVVAPASS